MLPYHLVTALLVGALKSEAVILRMNLTVIKTVQILNVTLQQVVITTGIGNIGVVA